MRGKKHLVVVVAFMFCLMSALPAMALEYVSVDEVTEGKQYGIVIYAGNPDNLEEVAVDSQGKPLLRGILQSALKRLDGVADPVVKDNTGGADFMSGDWWQTGWSDDGFKQVEVGVVVFQVVAEQLHL